MKYAFVVAGTHTGVGKTTTVLTLLGALHAKAMIVQPFKVGPDYLDPGYHNLFSGGRKSRSLDSYLLTDETIKGTFSRNLRRADIAVIEGMMGLYDGCGEGEIGSTAHVAKILKLPVIFVVDAQGVGQSAGAYIAGFKQFDPEVNLRGVIFNRVSDATHYATLKNSVPEDLGIQVLGYIPFDEAISIPEKNLGLASPLEHPLELSFFDKLSHASRFLDLDKLLSFAAYTGELDVEGKTEPKVRIPRKQEPVKIGVAYDEAFSFYYEDNFDLLMEMGAELIFFSPLYTDHLPPGIDGLYIGGGFPERFAPALSRNLAMMENIIRFAKEGHPVYAECGGLIYLSERFNDVDGVSYPMTGLIPGYVELTEELQSFGYKKIETRSDTFLFPKGLALKSHEYHYSRWIPNGLDFECPYDIGGKKEGYWSPPILASYQHLHFGTCPSLAANFVKSARTNKYPHARA